MYEPPIRATVLAALSNLTWSELRELDEAVTPRVAHLLGKAFGREMQDLLAPLTMYDR